MFRNRKITITVDKPNKEQTTTTPRDPEAFEKKTEFVLKKVGEVGVKVFAGVCIYVILDTRRQVAVAEALRPH